MNGTRCPACQGRLEREQHAFTCSGCNRSYPIADDGIIVVVPEPTSVENAYLFMKSAFLRRLKAIELDEEARVVGEEDETFLEAHRALDHRAPEGLDLGAVHVDRIGRNVNTARGVARLPRVVGEDGRGDPLGRPERVNKPIAIK